MTFQEAFAEDKENLDRAIQTNPAEQKHLERCQALAGGIRWENGTGGKDFEKMLGGVGSRIFSEVIARLDRLLQKEEAGELRDRRGFISNLMFAHDLGKFNRTAAGFDGSGHEERSAEIVDGKRSALKGVPWRQENVDLLADLVRYHGYLGITHIGEASIVFLNPLLVSLSKMASERRQLFLDLLIVLTCCDAGASGDFSAKRFYLDVARMKLYQQLADDLHCLSAEMSNSGHPDSMAVLKRKASGFEQTAVRIKRIATSSNRLIVGINTVERVLKEFWVSKGLDPGSFAITRFDHGAYVFEPLLAELGKGSRSVSPKTLHKLLFLIGILCNGRKKAEVIRFRESFSMKEDMRPANAKRFHELVDAVDRTDRKAIVDVMRRHKPRITPALI